MAVIPVNARMSVISIARTVFHRACITYAARLFSCASCSSLLWSFQNPPVTSRGWAYKVSFPKCSGSIGCRFEHTNVFLPSRCSAARWHSLVTIYCSLFCWLLIRYVIRSKPALCLTFLQTKNLSKQENKPMVVRIVFLTRGNDSGKPESSFPVNSKTTYRKAIGSSARIGISNSSVSELPVNVNPTRHRYWFLF